MVDDPHAAAPTLRVDANDATERQVRHLSACVGGGGAGALPPVPLAILGGVLV